MRAARLQNGATTFTTEKAKRAAGGDEKREAAAGANAG